MHARPKTILKVFRDALGPRSSVRILDIYGCAGQNDDRLVGEGTVASRGARSLTPREPGGEKKIITDGERREKRRRSGQAPLATQKVRVSTKRPGQKRHSQPEIYAGR
ncbi:hypothetical protein GWI33_003821 [Rhynchophorus ferrugineus]|uniref:Uncharacterized protein n=1 Tax=Rhynchophorus ferrugineus TaxID=354439 RepID=A0A834M2R3_RHYFE|nr:hypothetical protein GWI33_003821 [Rhynchophorus ferrugineus]